MPWEWNSTASEFHNTDTGERLSLEDVEDIVDQIIEEEADNVDDIIEIFLEGQEEDQPKDTRGWLLAFSVLLMDLYFILASLGIGGEERMTTILSADIEVLLQRQYQFLERFARDIEAERVPVGSIRQRMRMYVNSSRQSYWLMRDELELEKGSVQERWLDRGDSHVCNPCGEAGDAGWRPIGTYAQPGSGVVEISPTTMCAGLVSCRCRKEYR